MKEAIEVLGAPMHPWTMQETVAEIASRLERGIFTQHVAVNVAKVVNMRQDNALKASVAACDIISIDGMGVVWGGRFLGHDIPERVTGIDLFYNLMAISEEMGKSVDGFKLPE